MFNLRVAIWNRETKKWWTGTEWSEDPKKAILFASRDAAWRTVRAVGLNTTPLLAVDEDDVK